VKCENFWLNKLLLLCHRQQAAGGVHQQKTGVAVRIVFRFLNDGFLPRSLRAAMTTGCGLGVVIDRTRSLTGGPGFCHENKGFAMKNRVLTGPERATRILT